MRDHRAALNALADAALEMLADPLFTQDIHSRPQNGPGRDDGQCGSSHHPAGQQEPPGGAS